MSIFWILTPTRYTQKFHPQKTESVYSLCDAVTTQNRHKPQILSRCHWYTVQFFGGPQEWRLVKSQTSRLDNRSRPLILYLLHITKDRYLLGTVSPLSTNLKHTYSPVHPLSEKSSHCRMLQLSHFGFCHN